MTYIVMRYSTEAILWSGRSGMRSNLTNVIALIRLTRTQALFAIGLSPCIAYPYTATLVRRYFCLCGDTFLGSTPCLSQYVAVHPKLQNPTVLTSYDYLLMHTGYVEFALNGAGKEWRKSTCARNVNHILRPIALFREC